MEPKQWERIAIAHSIKPTHTLKEIITKLDLEWMFCEHDDDLNPILPFDANQMNLNQLAVLLHILSDGEIEVEFVEK